ncbi:hypothetical protein AAFF_G00288470 [Aldrovandia affinis]|uniref:Cytokine receptor-like factor 2-like D1 domain-containing protein n=1 Tax=Aldrovandia affinis TaxID=143900 RepID=A0AAD7WRX2_9TELE|nr:hypothetical protein AAFF_G00288470 [Aldrovandia affinis]
MILSPLWLSRRGTEMGRDGQAMAGVGAVSLVMAALLSGGDSHISAPRVSCLIINLEFINCMWTDQGIPEFNYTFHSSQSSPLRECPKYLFTDGYTMGCRLPYKRSQKFHKLHTRLSWENSSSERVQDIDLKDLVKLDPPHSLSLEVKEGESNPELWLHWNISCPSVCVESEVLYRQSNGQGKITVPIVGYCFSPPFFWPDELYEFQVRIRVPEACTQSKYWSDWSAPVSWVPIPRFNCAVSLHGPSNAVLCLWCIGWLWAAVGILIGHHQPT